MKVGMRTPDINKSIKARTTGKLKRSAKKTINPLYGKKGMGYINNPKKAVYNKIYSKTTFSAFSAFLPKSRDGIVWSILKICFLPAIFTIYIFYYFIKFIINSFNKSN